MSRFALAVLLAVLASATAASAIPNMPQPKDLRSPQDVAKYAIGYLQTGLESGIAQACEGPYNELGSFFQRCEDVMEQFSETMSGNTTDAALDSLCSNPCFLEAIPRMLNFFQCVKDYVKEHGSDQEAQTFVAFINIFSKAFEYVCTKNANGKYCVALQIDNANGASVVSGLQVCDFLWDAGCCVRSWMDITQSILDQDSDEFSDAIARNMKTTLTYCNISWPLEPCLKPGVPTRVVKATWKIVGVKFDYYNNGDEALKISIRRKLALDIAHNLGIPSGKVFIVSITQGSLVVNFNVQGSTNAESDELLNTVRDKGQASDLQFPELNSLPADAKDGSTISNDPTAATVEVTTETLSPAAIAHPSFMIFLAALFTLLAMSRLFA